MQHCLRTLLVAALAVSGGLVASQSAFAAGIEPTMLAGNNMDVPEDDQVVDDGAGATEGAAAVPQSQSDGRFVSRSTMLIGSLTVFFLAVFVGFEVITKVPPTLHTPLMSGSNAISGITVVGAMLTAGAATVGFGSILGMIALVLATINVVGGFLVTHRMLKMFKGGKRKT